MEIHYFLVFFVLWGSKIACIVDAESTCANVRCGFNTTCVMKTVQCFKAPCNSVPSCEPVASELIVDNSTNSSNETQHGENATETTSSCATVMCPSGSTCTMKQVQCVKAPCNPIPTCDKKTK